LIKAINLDYVGGKKVSDLFFPLLCGVLVQAVNQEFVDDK
jgi:hypothetical protein